jgi:hypothetical protein
LKLENIAFGVRSIDELDMAFVGDMSIRDLANSPTAFPNDLHECLLHIINGESQVPQAYSVGNGRKIILRCSVLVDLESRSILAMPGKTEMHAFQLSAFDACAPIEPFS